MDRRTFLGATAFAGALAACKSGGIPSFELDELTITDLAEGLRVGRWTSEHLTELYLSRIEALNTRGPELRAVIEVNPDAVAIAQRMDRGGAHGPLHGIPILIKDNIGTGDRMKTSAGSLALENSHAPKDSDVAARLRAAGAIILGKTNLSEWANYRSTHSVSGWSGRGGLTRNPYALDRNASGSSSGSAAAAAANMCAAAVGSETDGSIVSPASINGLVGVKPTLGVIGGEGIVPLAHSQDTAGPMTRTVRDAAILLSVLGTQGLDYTAGLDPGRLKGARLGVARKFFEKNAPLNRFLDDCVDALKKLGAEVIDPADLPSQDKWGEPESIVLSYEFKNDVNAYLASLSNATSNAAPVRTLEDLIAFNEKYRDREMPYFAQELFLQAEARGPLTEPAYIKARADCLQLSRDEGIDAVIAQHRLDAIVCLTGGPAWYTDLVNGDSDTGGCSTPAAVAGYPHVTVPAGLYRGTLPLGLSFFGTAMSEPVLLKLAYAWEQNMKARRPPRFLSRS